MQPAPSAGKRESHLKALLLIGGKIPTPIGYRILREIRFKQSLPEV